MREVVLYLISDCTGDTLQSVVKASVTRFPKLSVEQKVFSLVRSKDRIDEIKHKMIKTPGIVMYTIVDMEIRNYLKEICDEINIKYIAVLSPIINTLSEYLNMETSEENVGKLMDEDYFKRIHAINFTLAHDDGQMMHNLEEADIILLGASRTSKSPTAVYLGYRGYNTANIPFFKEANFPEHIKNLTHPLIVGLTISPSRLYEIRKNRLLAFETSTSMNYTDMSYIEEEIKISRRIFNQNGWPTLDVTRKSVEETAATIIQLLLKHRKKLKTS